MADNMTISEYTNRNFDALTIKTMSARDMALCDSRCHGDHRYMRTKDGGLWIWSQGREAWVLIETDPSRAW